MYKTKDIKERMRNNRDLTLSLETTLKKDNYKTRDTLERNLVTYILNKGLSALLHKVIIE